jgi:FtsP/CotA-like multicopper oxidase with cupredoxin domain
MMLHELDAPSVDMERLFMLDDVDVTPTGELAPFDLEEGFLNATWGRMGNVMLVNGESIREEPLSDDLVGGGVERWRLVNNANARTLYLELTGAEWKMIARDGTLLAEPQVADRLRLAAGQRIDLEVHPAESEVELTIFTRNKEMEGENFQEIVAFRGEPDTPGEAASWLDWPAPELEEITEPTQEISLLFDGEEVDDTMEWTINGIAWPDEPTDGFTVVQADMPTRIVVTNETDYVHPFHMHGNFFQLVTRDGVEPDYTSRFDTIMVEENQELVLFSTVPNPGLWMTHCHILEHAALGMMTALDVREAE